MSKTLFNPDDPFPLRSVSYQEAQKHSEEADRWLGLNTAQLESAISLKYGQSKNPDEQHWIGLPIQTLLTPYIELRIMLSILAPTQGVRVVDLGAGYGRMGFVLARHYPEVDFVGYEIIEERAVEAQRGFERHQCTRAKMICGDLSKTSPVLSDIYFIYDYGSRTAVLKTLEDLKKIANRRPIVVIGRGRLARDLIEQETPWLSQVTRPAHHGNFSIYRS
jgi:hypothetical protein